MRIKKIDAPPPCRQGPPLLRHAELGRAGPPPKPATATAAAPRPRASRPPRRGYSGSPRPHAHRAEGTARRQSAALGWRRCMRARVRDARRRRRCEPHVELGPPRRHSAAAAPGALRRRRARGDRRGRRRRRRGGRVDGRESCTRVRRPPPPPLRASRRARSAAPSQRSSSARRVTPPPSAKRPPRPSALSCRRSSAQRRPGHGRCCAEEAATRRRHGTPPPHGQCAAIGCDQQLASLRAGGLEIRPAGRVGQVGGGVTEKWQLIYVTCGKEKKTAFLVLFRVCHRVSGFISGFT